MSYRRYKILSEKDKKYVWHPFTHIEEWEKEEIIVVDKGKGPYLVDVRGKKYIDGVSSLWCNVWGYKFNIIDNFLKKQIDNIAHSTMLGLSNVNAIELAEELLKIAPKSLHRVFYSDSGSEAVEVALKISYQYWQNKGYPDKNKFISFVNAYHGDTIGAVSVGGIDLFHSVYQNLLFDTFKIPAPYCYRCQKRKNSACCFESLNILEDVLKQNKDNICGIIVEPKIFAAGGFIVQPDGFLKKIEQLSKKYGVHLILDEVATGFGRTGKMFACEYEKVNPDIMAIAKSLSGGYLPISATLVSREIFDAFRGDYKKTFYHGHTFTGNALACAVAVANLKCMKRYKLLDNVKKMSKILKEEIEKFYNLPGVGDIRQIGLMCGIELVKNKETKEEFSYEERVGYKITLLARKYGLFIRPLGNIIVLMPYLNIKENVLRKIILITYRSIKEFFENYQNQTL
ncbi:MAG: adenosylmethionine--8-amino-7-oxononanoate transaminase [Planctomycetota bacterium]